LSYTSDLKREEQARYQKYMTRIREVIKDDERKNRPSGVSGSSCSKVKDEL
jgi:hypothetical protein